MQDRRTGKIILETTSWSAMTTAAKSSRTGLWDGEGNAAAPLALIADS
jgi:hypothetical protein